MNRKIDLGPLSSKKFPRNMETSITDHNGVNTVMVRFKPNTPFNPNNLVRLSIEDAARLMIELKTVLVNYNYQNEYQAEAINKALGYLQKDL